VEGGPEPGDVSPAPQATNHGGAPRRRLLPLVTLLVTALSLGASWSHILQIRGKAAWDAALWRTAMESLYRDYATLGAVTEMGAIVLAWTLTISYRRLPSARRWSSAAAALLTFAFFALWLGFVAPINAVIATWSPNAMPTDWMEYRNRWEMWHAVIAMVKAGAFCALVCAALAARDRSCPGDLPGDGAVR